MATGVFEGAAAQAALEGLFFVIKNVVMKSFLCKRYCRRLEKTLEALIPILDEIFQTGVELSEERHRQLREFHGKLVEGTKLVKKCSNLGPLSVYKSYKYSKQILALEKYIGNFALKVSWAHTWCDVNHLRAHVCRKLEDIEKKVERNIDSMMLKQMIRDQMCQIGFGAEAPDSSLLIPELPKFKVGLEKLVEVLKEKLFAKECLRLLVKGIGGSGKTTLATALCNDPQVQEHFNGKIIFQTVSQSPNLKGLLETMWGKIVGGHRPDFHTVEDAHRQLLQRLRQMKPRPVLVVLDDVWRCTHLEKLMFDVEGFKTVVTSRHDFQRFDSTHNSQMLGDSDAMSLFCFWAFGQPSIPETADENLVKQVIAECKGLPLALEVIGGSLRDQPHVAWMSAKNKLSRADAISDHHKDRVLKCLATSINALEDEVQQCFMDLGSFPEDKKISVDALLDIWVFVHDLERVDAYVILIELANRNLLNLLNNPMSQLATLSSYESNPEFYIVQHDVLRDLALYLAKQEHINERRRLMMPKKEFCVPKSWIKQGDRPFKAQIVSIHTGAMKKEDWREMNFPEAEALLLIFDATPYFLPSFLKTMHKLKVLIIVNQASKRAELKDLSAFLSLGQLKSIRLERLVVPSLNEHPNSLPKLEKLSLILCECHSNMTVLDMGPCLNFPGLREITIDYCKDLEELPASICKMTSLQKMSVTNCPNLKKLCDDFGKLTSLKMLRLYACPSLVELPYSVCKLERLEFLDISLCECMRKLPEELGKLSNLKELDMRECPRIKSLPRSAGKLVSLRHVICDEKVGCQWSDINASAIPNLYVEVAEENFHLNWLSH